MPSTAECWELYEQMFRIRQFELAAQKLYQAGEMPGFIHLYIGQEAVAVGVCAHLQREDWITSTHRGHGHALAKGVPAGVLLAELYGKASGCCGGRGGSMHLYSREVGLFGTNGFVGGGLPATVGLGLGAKLRGTGRVAVAFFGDGAVNHGAFHEAANLAAVQGAPVVFVCENNLYATATPLGMATRNTDLASRGAAYGLPGVAVDGNDVLAVWEATRLAVEQARNGEGPTLIEAKTYRLVGHHEGDPPAGSYRSTEEVMLWMTRCPLTRLRRSFLETGQVSTQEVEEIEKRVLLQIEEAIAFARNSAFPEPSSVGAHVWANPLNPPVAQERVEGDSGLCVEQSWIDAVCQGIAEEMRANPHLIYLGEGIGERGGSFAHTKGLWKEFGPERVIDTPISELGFTGAALGASASGCRAIADLMFADFLFEAASQIIQQAGKLRYMSNGQIGAPVIVRAAIGAVEKGAGPHHSGTYYPIWAHCPGMIIVVPSNPSDAKALMKTALHASDPVLFLEHKALFGMRGRVPVEGRYLPFGRAAIVREGTGLTLVTCGELVHRSLEASAILEHRGVDCEIIDLRTIVPLDMDTILGSIAKTGRLLIVDEAFPMCGIGAEISARVMEEAFDELDAPVGRLHPLPATHPCSPILQKAMMVTVDKIVESAQSVMNGRPIAPHWASEMRQGMVPPSRHDVPSGASLPLSGVVSTPVRAANGEVPILVPNQDLTVTEATVLRWLKRVGDRVQASEGIVEVETAKALILVEAPSAGIITSILVEEGTSVAISSRQPLGTIRGEFPSV